MKKPSQITRSRAKRRNQGLTPPASLGLVVAGILSLIITVLLLWVVISYTRTAADLPSLLRIEQLLDPENGELLKPTTILDRQGQEIIWQIDNPYLKEREYAHLDLEGKYLQADIPQDLVKAAVVVSDPNFFTRNYWGLSQWWKPHPDALVTDLITDLLLWNTPDQPFRDFRTNLLSAQLISEYGHMQVLEWYLNNAYFGNQIYGVDAAAKVYFEKPVNELHLSESVLLAAVSETPSLNPWDAPSAARENHQALLDLLVQEGLMTREEIEDAEKFPLTFTSPDENYIRDKPEVVDLILSQASRYIPEMRLLRGGIEIVSTIDYQLQSQLECVLEHQAERLTDQAASPSSSCEAARLLPFPLEEKLSEENSLVVQVVMLDSRTGQVLAADGYPQGHQLANFKAAHDPGSLLTPFIYLSGFTQGLEPASLVWDTARDETDFNVELTHPNCEDDCAYQGPVSIRTALVNDYLIPAIELWENEGAARVENMISRVGIDLDPQSCPECTLFPGSHRVRILDIAHGFSVFSNLGVMYGVKSPDQGTDILPVLILNAADSSGKKLIDNQDVFNRSVLSDQLAYLVNHVLSDENARKVRTQQNLFEIGRPAGVKVGNTAGSASWTVGYTPQLVTAVWTAGDGPAMSEELDLSRVSAGIWRALTQYASKNYPGTDWEIPEGIIFLDVCSPSGLLPTEYCPEVTREIFIEGNEPVRVDDLYQVFEVNRETGRRATVFTPAELIERRVYLNVPPRAADWAKQQGLTVPPEAYDPGSTTSSTPQVQILQPQNYSYVRGVVDIVGQIKIEDFVSYRLQVGKGLNPDSWQQINQEEQVPFGTGKLGKWNTLDLEDGLYALQLVVLKEQQRVEKASVLVSVDNTAPQLALIGLEDEAQLEFVSGKELLFQAQAEDNVQLDRVEFYLNSRLVKIRTDAPYVFSWKMGVGDFTLMVKAIDAAGNEEVVAVDLQITR